MSVGYIWYGGVPCFVGYTWYGGVPCLLVIVGTAVYHVGWLYLVRWCTMFAGKNY